MKVFFLCALTLPAFAGEYAILSNGFQMHADRHEKVGQTVLLYTQQGVTELPAALVASFENEDYTPPKPASTQPLLPAAAPPASPQDLVRAAAQRAAIPIELVHSVAKAES